MTETERQILKALIELETVVKGIAASRPKPDLAAHLSRIDELTSQLPRSTAPGLLHYLQKKSYPKARLWLEGQSSQIQKGGCRR